MAFFSEWITDIILFVLLAMLVELLLPRSTMQKYVKMVLGLLLIFIMLNPIMKLLAMDPQEWLDSFAKIGLHDEGFKKSLEKQKLDIQARQHAYILKELADRLKEQTEKELMEQYRLEIADIHFNMRDGRFTVNDQGEGFLENIRSIQVTLREGQTGAVEPVQEVVIAIDGEGIRKETEFDYRVRDFLARKWGVEAEMIEIFVDGRDP